MSVNDVFYSACVLIDARCLCEVARDIASSVCVNRLILCDVFL